VTPLIGRKIQGLIAQCTADQQSYSLTYIFNGSGLPVGFPTPTRYDKVYTVYRTAFPPSKCIVL